MKNKYIAHSRISEAKFREILDLFCINIKAQNKWYFCDVHN
ncbi:hypothetical protein SAMN05421544_11631 [Riemerella columbipharyngis]|uniref:Uncharacterized protein n=1 Tax=Riemerella columbipharyngis TaxID=1071918 RepID=A0A1G7EKF4_9FLAO|nr:hypothetical protein SAMN05421544_11631 [Riemerella columbipharyngis]